MIAFLSVLIAFLAPQASATVSGDLNCTTYNGTEWVWSPSAANCQNVISDASCAILYPQIGTQGWPAAGGNQQRPSTCSLLVAATPAPVDQGMKDAAIASCPKTCGYCCQTDAYNCKNVDFPRIPCASITASQCSSPIWRTIIAQDCPSACGLCGQGGCVDAVTNCATDMSICQNVGMQDFVNQYCQKTCGRCPSTTTSGSNGGNGGNCSSYAADTTTNCAAWAANGFCSNTFYTYEQRKSRCATTCRFC